MTQTQTITEIKEETEDAKTTSFAEIMKQELEKSLNNMTTEIESVKTTLTVCDHPWHIRTPCAKFGQDPLKTVAGFENKEQTARFSFIYIYIYILDCTCVLCMLSNI